MNKTVFVNVNGNNYGFTCRSFIRDDEEYKIVNQCDLQLGDKILASGECRYNEVPSYEGYEFSNVIHSAVRMCRDSEYFRMRDEFLAERNRTKLTPKLEKEFLEIFNNTPLIKDMNELWYNRLKTSIWN